MRVIMRTYYAGPAGSAQPGGVLTVSDEEGAALIAGKYAEAVAETATAPAEEVATEAAADVAEVADAPAPETATAPRGNKRGR